MVDCSCGALVHRQGRTAIPCEYCSSRHWDSGDSAEKCEFWAKWRRGDLEIFVGDEFKPRDEGSKEPTPKLYDWSWGFVRENILRRDKKFCLDCGYTPPVYDIIILKDLLYPKVKGDNYFLLNPEKGDPERGDYPRSNLKPGAFTIPVLEVHHLLPRDAGGSDHPANLRTLCHDCHLERHKAIGDGYDVYPKVLSALKMDEFEGEERARILDGTHPLVVECRRLVEEAREYALLPEKVRILREELKTGIQRTFEVK